MASLPTSAIKLLLLVLANTAQSIEILQVGDDATVIPGDDGDATLMPDYYPLRQEPLNETMFGQLRQQPVNESMAAADFLDTNPELVDGRRLFEGDMMLTDEDWRLLSERKFMIATDPRSKWPKGSDGKPQVPYRFLSSATSSARTAIAAGIAHWQAETCLRFPQTTNLAQPHIQFASESGCWSYVGRQYNSNGQKISIGTGCTTMGTVAHEIGHAIGFQHEQSRTDRDNYVQIHSENIQPRRELNFEKENTKVHIQYDYKSVMHYAPKGFTKNGFPTISTNHPKDNQYIGSRTALSFFDKLMANKEYGCIDMWENDCGMNSSMCNGDGYIGASCSCVCPPGFSGTTCETQDSPPSAQPDGCTRNVTQEGTITVPPGSTYLKCTIDIRAPACHAPRLQFTTFNLYRRTRSSGCTSDCCYFDSLELRENYPNTATDIYCYTDLQGQTKTGSKERLVLYYHRRWSRATLTATLTFVPIPSCDATNTTTTTDATNTTTTTDATTNTTTTDATTTTTTTDAATTTTDANSTTTTEPTCTTTTPPPPAPSTKCLTQVFNGSFYYSSPNFDSNYPNNKICSLGGFSSSSPLHIKSVVFDLVPDGCKDYVKVTTLYDRTITYCGDKDKINFKSPSFNFRLQFFSDGADTATGFNISLTPRIEPNEDCHETIQLSAGQKYVLKSPFFGQNKVSDKAYCEWRLKAPVGNVISVKKLVSRIKPSADCEKDFLLLNGYKQSMYPMATSEQYCSKFKMSNLMTTNTTDLYVAYQKTRAKTKGFRLVAKVMPTSLLLMP